MEKNDIILTIGMPVYNDVLFLEESINSILNQRFSNFKLIISDDYSIDGSQSICEKIEKLDSRVLYIRQKNNIGISRNMQFLLSLANTKYFMWAGDDDIYNPEFIEQLVFNLENTNAISAFSNFSTIDESGAIIKMYNTFNYTEKNKYKRLNKFIKNAHDAFGYGIFKTDYIKDVKFPTWWWPNNKTPYNNIYPTLCFYLAKGNYSHCEKLLFYKRIKTKKHTHHILVGNSNAIKESLSFWVRRFNLIIISFKGILRADTLSLATSVFPSLIYYWFIIPSVKQFNLAFSSFLRNKLRIIK